MAQRDQGTLVCTLSSAPRVEASILPVKMLVLPYGPCADVSPGTLIPTSSHRFVLG